METPAVLAQWTAVDNYFSLHQISTDAVLQAALHDSNEAGLPPHNVAPNQGKFLHLLARIHGAKNILEIGTLGAYSTIWFARALPEGVGKVVTLEMNEKCVAVAQHNLKRAGLQDRVEVILGKAEESLARLVAEERGPFDMIFIDADKPNNTIYLRWSMKLARQGTVIIADNVVRHGEVLNPTSTDTSVRGVQDFTQAMAADPRLTATTIQTVGSKGWDGFTMAIVNKID